MIKATKGKIADTAAALASLEDWKYNSPRGPISIDPIDPRHRHERVSGRGGEGAATASCTQKQIGKIEQRAGARARPRRSAPARRSEAAPR